MGLLEGLLGNASKVDAATVQQEFAKILAPGETVQHAYQLIRDYFVFTDKRFVLGPVNTSATHQPRARS